LRVTGHPACGALEHAVSAGLADSWGISTWQPRSIADVLTSVPVDDRPRPAVVMVRSGLLVSAAGLAAGEHLAALLNPVRIRGMGPFGGDTSDPVWNSIDSRLFLAADQPCSRWQAAFRVAAQLPNVGQLVLVGGPVTRLGQSCHCGRRAGGLVVLGVFVASFNRKRMCRMRTSSSEFFPTYVALGGNMWPSRSRSLSSRIV
jgi:hypothetical protein